MFCEVIVFIHCIACEQALFFGWVKRAAREHTGERQIRERTRKSFLSRNPCFRVSSRASTFHDIPQMESLLAGYTLHGHNTWNRRLWFVAFPCDSRTTFFRIPSFRLACENIRFSSLFAAGDVSRGGTSATQRQKFRTDDANQCLHNKSSSHGVPNTNLSNFTCLLVDFGKVLCSSANELQQNSNASSREDYIPQILTVLLQILRVYIWPLWPFVFCLSFINNS